MMLHDGVVDLHAASWLASANYLGYLSGALLCTFVPLLWSRLPGRRRSTVPALVRAGLAGTGVLTLAMALPLPAAWPAAALPGRRRQRDGVRVRLRLVPDAARAARPRRARRRDVRRAGRRHRRERPAGERAGRRRSHVGPGMARLRRARMPSHRVDLARVPDARGRARCRAACRVERSEGPRRRASPRPLPPPTITHPHGEVATLAFAYGISGFGYIVTATFLPVIARAALPADSPWLDLFWPIFGAGVIVGAVLATRVRVGGDLRLAARRRLSRPGGRRSPSAWPADRRRLRARQPAARPAVHRDHLLRAAGSATPPARITSPARPGSSPRSGASARPPARRWSPCCCAARQASTPRSRCPC